MIDSHFDYYLNPCFPSLGLGEGRWIHDFPRVLTVCGWELWDLGDYKRGLFLSGGHHVVGSRWFSHVEAGALLVLKAPAT